MKKHIAIVIVAVLSLALQLSAKQSSLFNFSDSHTSVSGTLAATTLFTPTADSDYQACIYIEDITHTGSAEAQLNWTDDNGSQASGVVSGGAPGYVGNQCFAIHGLANDPVTLSATDSGTGQTYNIFVTVIGQ
jgi:hypothetical protein